MIQNKKTLSQLVVGYTHEEILEYLNTSGIDEFLVRIPSDVLEEALWERQNLESSLKEKREEPG